MDLRKSFTKISQGTNIRCNYGTTKGLNIEVNHKDGSWDPT